MRIDLTNRVQAPGGNVKRLLALAITVTTWSCSSESAKPPSTSDTTKGTTAASTSGGVDLTGAGATFPQPIYNKWFAEYAAKTGVKINYQAIGSGGGIRQFLEGTVDFGATDAPMTDEEIGKLKAPAYHIPTVVGVIAIAYNLPQLAQPLKLTGQIVADIFLGKITKWNDPRIASLNAGVTLPTSDILVVHRSEGSGTTYIFSQYLSMVSPEWKSGPGTGKELQWPVGLGAKGNESVSGQVKQTPGALGYMELAYARQSRLGTALLQNAAGQFVAPTADAATAAAEGAVATLPPTTDYRISIVNAKASAAYPITSLTWLLVSTKQPDPAKGKKIADFLRWALSDGQKDAAALDYAPLPASLVSKLMPRIDSIAPRAAP
jgi:phosphate transport system substrate-binding protein